MFTLWKMADLTHKLEGKNCSVDIKQGDHDDWEIIVRDEAGKRLTLDIKGDWSIKYSDPEREKPAAGLFLNRGNPYRAIGVENPDRNTSLATE